MTSAPARTARSTPRPCYGRSYAVGRARGARRRTGRSACSSATRPLPPAPGGISSALAASDKVWCKFTGICFDGKAQRCNMIDSAVDGSSNPTTPVLWHTASSNAASRTSTTPSRMQSAVCGSRTAISRTACARSHIAGADCHIEDNVISGSNWHSGGTTNSDSAGATTFAVKLGSWRMSWFERNFITGWPQMPHVHLRLGRMHELR